jgi:hypothetical protein
MKYLLGVTGKKKKEKKTDLSCRSCTTRLFKKLVAVDAAHLSKNPDLQLLPCLCR